MKTTILAAPAWAALFTCAIAASAVAEPIALTDAYIRAMPPNAPVAGGYVTITNSGPQDDRLIAASSSRAREVQIHEMTMNGNVMKMRELPDGLPIPAGQTVALTPGGYHLMFIGVPDPYAQGQSVPTTLVFQHAGKVELTMPVRAMRAAPSGHRGHAASSDHGGH